jgi:hypothetical protein
MSRNNKNHKNHNRTVTESFLDRVSILSSCIPHMVSDDETPVSKAQERFNKARRVEAEGRQMLLDGMQNELANIEVSEGVLENMMNELFAMDLLGMSDETVEFMEALVGESKD